MVDEIRKWLSDVIHGVVFMSLEADSGKSISKGINCKEKQVVIPLAFLLTNRVYITILSV